MTYAKPSDISDRWLSSTPLPKDETIQKWLDDAEVLIFAEFPELATRLLDDRDGLWASRIVYVENQLVSTALKNPDAVRQSSRTAGVFTEANTYGTETLSQAMELTPAHRAMLSGRAKKHSGFDMTGSTPSTVPDLTGAVINDARWGAPGEGA